MADSRETLHAFVVGTPIRHSRSPLIHGHWLQNFAIAGDYRAIEVLEADFERFIQSLKSDQVYRGGNVTIPHKERAYQLADQPDALAEELGAANTLWLEDGVLHATNTDGYGFTANLDARAPGWEKATSAVILGAGGASRAIIQAVRDRGIGEIHVVNRTVARAQELADRFGPAIHAHAMGELSEVMLGAGLFINTTSLGMDGEGSIEIDFSAMGPDAVVTDIVYVPLETPILEQARIQGLRTVDGLGMLLHQAVPGFEKWFGQRPQVSEDLRAMIIQDMENH
jgi:shikimate dehydrogenase